MKLFKGAALVASAQAGFVESGLDAMRDSSFLGEADRKIIADQQRMVLTGNKGERMHIHIEANGECDSDFPTFDGTCVREDNKGRTARPLTRLVPADYCDGKSAPRCARNGKPLPNARALSNAFHMDKNDQITDPSHMSHMHMLWGQFLVHDVVLTPGTKIENVDCSCGSTNPECANIEISSLDKDLTADCIEMKRSHRTYAEFNGLIYEEQISVISSFVDGTVIYGTDKMLTKTLRHSDREAMAVSMNEKGLKLLPRTNETSENKPGEMGDPLVLSDDVRKKFSAKTELNERELPAFVSGDARINEHPALQGLHTVFHHLHNWACHRIAEHNPSWKGMTDMLFHEARMVVIAAIQHISYNDYLTTTLGPDMMKKAGLTPSKTVTTFDEDAALDPTFLNECSTVAFRFGHSQIANTIPCLNPDWEEQENPVNLLQDNYFDPFLVDKHGPDGIVRGNVATHGMAVDTSFAEDIRNNLFKAFGSNEGGDLFAINIQRGREHGIGDYLSVRRWCRDHGYDEPVTFMPGMQSMLETEYDHVNDIDLYVGGLAEEPLPGGVVGPTLGCILAEQFKRIKSANKFFYTNDNVFSNAQLRELRKLDLATVLCAAGQDTVTVPKDPFFLGSKAGNRLIRCDEIDYPDFSVWSRPDSVSKSLFRCKFDEASNMLDCGHKNWDDLLYLTEAAEKGSMVPARSIQSGFRALDLDLLERKPGKAEKKKNKADKKKKKADKKKNKNKDKDNNNDEQQWKPVDKPTDKPVQDQTSDWLDQQDQPKPINSSNSTATGARAADVHYLSLRGNKLPDEKAVAKLVKAFPNLKGIDISNNMLDEIPAEVFQLSDWRVSGNNIGCISLETIEEGFRPHSNFKDEL